MPSTYKHPPRLDPEDKMILEKLELGYTLRSKYHPFRRQLDYFLDLAAGPLAISAKRINKLVRRGLLVNRRSSVVLPEKTAC